MNILYLHGLDSKLSPPKKQMLQKYGTVYAPEIDYYNTPNAIEIILKQYEKNDINTVVGSSMGGFAGYYIADALDKPALLFNPALSKRSVPQEIPQEQKLNHSFKFIVIGQRDEVVNPIDTLRFIAGNMNLVTDFHIHLRHEMQHQVELGCFEEELEIFFEKICY